MATTPLMIGLRMQYKQGQTNTSADFLAQFPFGTVPAFVAPCGKTLSDTNAIAQYGSVLRRGSAFFRSNSFV